MVAIAQSMAVHEKDGTLDICDIEYIGNRYHSEEDYGVYRDTIYIRVTVGPCVDTRWRLSVDS